MAAEPECWCEHVDIGVGEVKVAENYDCPRCHPQPAFGAAADTRYDGACSADAVRCALSVHAVCPFHH